MKQIKSALISVFHKEGLERIIRLLTENNVTIYSTDGTQRYIEEQGGRVVRVEDITDYPSILGGRVKTLHPKVFGGILAKREEEHLSQLEKYEIPEIDLVIVDLYPFEETVKATSDESQIIEKIDIGGISLIRAAAKNYRDVVVVPSKSQYKDLESALESGCATDLSFRKEMAKRAFEISSHYDTAIFDFFNESEDTSSFKKSISAKHVLRYGENPHQKGIFFGEMDSMFEKLGGKELSYNNIVDVDAAVGIMREFKDGEATFAILKHTNTCGLSTRGSVMEAWKAALAGDPISAFGGILICNQKIDLATAEEINKIFYEVVIAPEFDEEAKNLLMQKKKRILLKIKHYELQPKSYKSVLNGAIVQDSDAPSNDELSYEVKTKREPSAAELEDLAFANKCAKHLKSNTIVLARRKQLLGMGCGQTSRVDACKQAIEKAARMGFDLKGAVMASDAFFPFPDCVELAYEAGISAVVQPGGSIKDQLSIDVCNDRGMAMVFTGERHFKH